MGSDAIDPSSDSKESNIAEIASDLSSPLPAPSAPSAPSSADYSYIALEKLGSYLSIVCRDWERVVRPPQGVGVARSLPPVSLKKIPSFSQKQQHEQVPESPKPQSARSVVLAPVVIKKTFVSPSASIKIRTRSLQDHSSDPEHQQTCDQIQRLFSTLPLAVQSQLVEQLQQRLEQAPSPSAKLSISVSHQSLGLGSASSVSPRKSLTILSTPPRSPAQLSRSIDNSNSEPQENLVIRDSGQSEVNETKASVQEDQPQDESKEPGSVEVKEELKESDPMETEQESTTPAQSDESTQQAEESDEKEEETETSPECTEEKNVQAEEQEEKQHEEDGGAASVAPESFKPIEPEESKEEQGQEQQGSVILKYNISRRLHKLSHVPAMPELPAGSSRRTLPPLNSTRTRLLASALEAEEALSSASEAASSASVESELKLVADADDVPTASRDNADDRPF